MNKLSGLSGSLRSYVGPLLGEQFNYCANTVANQNGNAQQLCKQLLVQGLFSHSHARYQSNQAASSSYASATSAPLPALSSLLDSQPDTHDWTAGPSEQLMNEVAIASDVEQARMIAQKPDLVDKYLNPEYLMSATRRRKGREDILMYEYGWDGWSKFNEEQAIVYLTERINAYNKHIDGERRLKTKHHHIKRYLAKRFRLLTRLRYDNFKSYARLITRLSLPDTFHERQFPMVDPIGSNPKGHADSNPGSVTSDTSSHADDAALVKVQQTPTENLLQARLEKYHANRVFMYEKTQAVERMYRIEQFYMKMLQDKVWLDLRLDHPVPDKPDVAFTPQINEYWIRKKRMIQSCDDLKKQAAKPEIARRWRRVIKPWTVDTTRLAFKSHKLHWNKHLHSMLRKWCPLFIESKMYETWSEWAVPPNWRAAPQRYILERMGVGAAGGGTLMRAVQEWVNQHRGGTTPGMIRNPHFETNRLYFRRRRATNFGAGPAPWQKEQFGRETKITIGPKPLQKKKQWSKRQNPYPL